MSKILDLLSPIRWYVIGAVAALFIGFVGYVFDGYGDYREQRCEAKYSDAFVAELQSAVKVQTAIAADRAARANKLETDLAKLAFEQTAQPVSDVRPAPVAAAVPHPDGTSAEWLRGHQSRAARRRAKD